MLLNALEEAVTPVVGARLVVTERISDLTDEPATLDAMILI
jgi:hypothetical protein